MPAKYKGKIFEVKRTTLILFLVILFNACKKDEGPSMFDFLVSGIEKIEARVEETHILRLLVTGNGFAPENVYLNLEDVPKGITYTIDNAAGVPEFASTLIIRVSRDAEGGTHKLRLIASSGKLVKQFFIDLDIDKSLSAIFTVYNSVTYNPENMSSNLVDSALVNLYKDHSTFLTGIPDYKVYTTKSGKAMFFKVPPGNYLFTIEKDGLTNIVQKRDVGGVMKGFIVAGLFRSQQEIINSAQPKAKLGDLKFRDVNADNKIDALDLGQYDSLSIYDSEMNEKVIWIGQ
jgi:hypothetical protein